MSERTPMEALRSALHFAASRSCITSAEELAIMDAWNNTRPQPSDEPVVDPIAEETLTDVLAELNADYPGHDEAKRRQFAAAVIASALEQVRKDALEEGRQLATAELATFEAGIVAKIANWFRAGAGQNTQNLSRSLKILCLRGMHSHADAIERGEWRDQLETLKDQANG